METDRILFHSILTRYCENVVGGSVTLASGGRVLWHENSGWARLEPETPSSASTQFRIGSITKTFTAVCLLLLAEEGLLDVDSPIHEHVPELGGIRATLRQILSHTSGLQREHPSPMWETFEAPGAGEFEKTLRDVVQVSSPGLRWHYSNLGFGLLAEVVRRVVGSFEDFVEERLFRPLGLRDTTWAPREPFALGYYSDPYDERFMPDKIFNMRALSAAGQLWSTSADIARWAGALAGLRREIVSPSVVEAMHVPHAMTNREWTAAWGLGLALRHRDGRVLSGHDGVMPGFTAAISLDRSSGTVAAALLNAGTGVDVIGLTDELVAAAVERSPSLDPAPRVRVPCPPELAGVLGRWWSEGLEFVFTWNEGTLRAVQAVSPGEPARFERTETNLLRVISGRERGEVLEIVRDAAENVLFLRWAGYPFTRRPYQWDL